MKLTYVTELPANRKAEALVIGVYEGLKNVSRDEADQLKAVNLSGKAGEVTTLPGTEIFRALIFVGLG